MAKTTNAKAKKLTKADREHIDNQIVLATAIGLVSAIFLLYLYRWLNSSYIMQTMLVTDILIWICDAGILAGLVLFFWKKERKYFRMVPYFAGGAFLLSIIRYFHIYKRLLDALYISVLWQKAIDALKVWHPTNQQIAFIFVYLCIAAYLIATYIYYGRKLHRAK